MKSPPLGFNCTDIESGARGQESAASLKALGVYIYIYVRFSALA